MRISFLGWESSGLRVPDVAIRDLRSASGREGPGAVTLIQMPNGTGKTTTLELLKATLSGTAEGWDAETVRSYRRRGEDRDEGTFTVTLEVDDRPLTIELTLDFDAGQALYRTTNPGSGGVQEGYGPPPSVKRFLAPDFLELFVFDGEFAERLFDARRTEADDAVDALCQLYLLDEVNSYAEREWTRRTRSASGKSGAMLGKLEGQRDVLLARRERVASARARAETRTRTLEAEIAGLRQRIDGRINQVDTVRADADEARLRSSQADAALETATLAAMQAIRQPLALRPAFAAELYELKDNLDELRLPENTSAQFFLDLLDAENCICGRPMTEGAKTQIELGSKQYLGSADAGVLNAIKKDIGDYALAVEEDSTDALANALAVLARCRREAKDAAQELELITRRLIDSGDVEVGAWQDELVQKSKELLDCRTVLEEADADRDERPDASLFALAVLDRRIKEVGLRIAEITQTVTLRSQIDQLRQILARAKDLARRAIKDEIVDVSNVRLREVLRNDPVRIERIDRSLRLGDQAGASTGQMLAIGYVFLTAALSRGSNVFPLLVDSPANPIDAGRRRRVAALVPQLCSQFIGLIINTEFLGFRQELEDAAANMRYLTVFRQTAGTEHLLDRLPQGAVRSDNAIVVEGRDYFIDFDMTEQLEDD